MKKTRSVYHATFEIDPIYVTIGERMRNLRYQRSVLLREIADLLHYSHPTTVSLIESGRVRIAVHDLVKLAKFYGVHIDYFLMQFPEEEAR